MANAEGDMVPIPAVVDSGASNSVVTRNTLRKLDLVDAIEGTGVSFLNADGNRARAAGHVRELLISTGDMAITLDAFVSNATNYGILLGTDFLLPIRANLCYSRNLLEYDNDHNTRGSITVSFTRQESANMAEVQDREVSDTDSVSDPEAYMMTSQRLINQLNPEPCEELRSLLLNKINPDLSEADRQAIGDCLMANHDLFARTNSELGRTTWAAMKVDTGDSPPIFTPPYRMSKAERDAVDSQTRFYSSLDLKSGFWQVPMADEASKDRASFHTASSQWRYKVMPMGLKNSPAVFAELMRRVLAPVLPGSVPVGTDNGPQSEACAMVYLDDILIYSADITSHVRHLQQVFDLLRLASLKAAVKKCTFGQRRIQFLGHVLDGCAGTVSPSPRNVAVIASYPSPRNVRQVRALLGTVGYYRSFVPGFSLIARPLFDLLKKDAPWRWGTDEEQAFQTLKRALTSEPILRAPDFSRHFFVQTDFCKTAVAACLAQKGDDGKEYAVQFASKKLTPAQMCWSSADGEAYAAVWAIKLFRPYLYGEKFTLVTDSMAVRHLKTASAQDLRGKLARYALKLQQYDFDIVHRAGTTNGNVDGLSHDADGDEETDGSKETLPPDGEPEEQGDEMDLAEDLEDEEETEDGVRGKILQVWADERLLEYLRTGRLKTLPGQSGEDYMREMNRVRKRSARYGFEGDTLYKSRPGGKSRVRVPPPEERLYLIRDAHGMGHFGFNKTYAFMGERFWWEGMKEEVRAYVRSCESCRADRHKLLREIPLRPLPIVPLWTRVHIDCMGPYKRTVRGNKYCILAVDSWSKYPEVGALPNRRAATVRTWFWENWICRYGTPAEVLTDRGGEFAGVLDPFLKE
ncbi:hypothetical protein GPECTOR_645g759 [Gonium pectorale]|uniref:Reverse transcriptase n=1 Tax=Gonium pectorale TaxID=33097 RepID=A0A150FUC6_GONPE|nr:hypothetical protein GPECTOR_645g759 [Gonium pectorale]|eukprot:KXZ41214.1 hypothetical protein GPECTOR_645g759 [Gonium pectorale]